MKNIKKHPFKHPHEPQQDLPVKKKAYGQHFLRKHSTVDAMISTVEITPETTIVEIGCGDGFLTSAILQQTRCKKLICFEIDPEWAEHVREKIKDPRLDLRLKNVLDVAFDEEIPGETGLVILANLPYQITFPIIYLVQRYKHLFKDIVVMVQEEVGQKLAAKSGKSFSAVTMFFQHHFSVKLLEKIEPGAFTPPPKVFSRLIQLTPREAPFIEDEENFWTMLKLCFKSPRQTLKNNLRSTHYDPGKLTADILAKRAQQLSFIDFLAIWNQIKK